MNGREKRGTEPFRSSTFGLGHFPLLSVSKIARSGLLRRPAHTRRSPALRGDSITPKPALVAAVTTVARKVRRRRADLHVAAASPHDARVEPERPGDRVRVSGKFLDLAGSKMYVRGVTYGTFPPDDQGNEYGDRASVERDFSRMAEQAINAVRTYTVPPRWLLDAALRHGLRVLVGLPWEQHVAFLEKRGRPRDIERRVREGVRACAGHPAVLAYAVGNEIPSPIVRWHGRRRIERFIKRLYRAVKQEDPQALVTYVNYPTTEYLDLPFLDLVCFNVYLESPEQLEPYLARLQNLAGDRPLLMAEIGLDSRRNGLTEQAESIEWQVRSSFGAGCAGTFVYAWTDRWYRGGHEIEDWDFGLVDRQGQPKPSLEAVRRAYAEVPFPEDVAWPRISVVVCTYNGGSTIRRCLDALSRLRYPDYEVIVVNDGSTDRTAAILSEYDFRVITTENRGLSSARNTGLEAASGEIVAYVDDDAFPDPDWLSYLAAVFIRTDHVGVGGPNIPPPEDGPIAACVANAPGGPIHVLIDDEEAEHIPGCNMAFRVDALRAVGGFDPTFRVAGDDVDLCWRLQDQGGSLGFSHGAMVFHHRRNSVRAYWRQQKGYGKAEALLEAKWPERYNSPGHVGWRGRVYAPWDRGGGRGRIYQGTWGLAPFQRIYQAPSGLLASLPAMPEWHLIVAVLGGLTALGLSWRPLLFAGPVFVLALAISVARAVLAGARAPFPSERTRTSRWKLRLLTAGLHLVQPVARLIGRVRFGLTPWRLRPRPGLDLPLPRSAEVWNESGWREPAEWNRMLDSQLGDLGFLVEHGGDYDRWDLQPRLGALAGARLRTTVEEHGGGKQNVRVRWWPHIAPAAPAVVVVLGSVGTGAALEAAYVPAGVLFAAAAILTAYLGLAVSAAMHGVRAAVASLTS